jgi:hypothetical protein
MTAVIINPSADGWRYSVRFHYDPTVVATIKQSIPGYARSWDAQRRAWYVDPDWVHALAAELRRHGHDVTGVDAPPAVRHSEKQSALGAGPSCCVIGTLLSRTALAAVEKSAWAATGFAAISRGNVLGHSNIQRPPRLLRRGRQFVETRRTSA